MINIKQLEIINNSVIFEVSNFTGIIGDYTIANNVEIKLADINKVFNELLHYDDITITIDDRQFTFNKKDFDYRLTEEEIRRFRCTPFAHQVEAINFGLKRSRSKWLLLDSMG